MNERYSNPGPAGGDESLAGRAEVVLLMVDGADFRRVGVDALDGVVTLSGEVKTESEKKQAAAVVRRVDGVHEVNNQLQVAQERSARARDEALKDRIEAALKSDQAFEGVKVESVRDGVLRVSGMVAVAEQAVELAWNAQTSPQILENASSEVTSEAKGVQ